MNVVEPCIESGGGEEGRNGTSLDLRLMAGYALSSPLTSIAIRSGPNEVRRDEIPCTLNGRVL